MGRKQESSLVMKSVKEIGNQCVQKIQNVFFRSFEFFEHALKSNIKKLNQKSSLFKKSICPICLEALQ